MPGPWKKLDLLVVALPIAVVVDLLSAPAPLVFLVGALAIVPLAGLIGRSTESIADKVGGAVGALLNATFGTFAELVIAALLVVRGEVAIVKASIVGSLVGNLLLLLGVSIVISSYDRVEITFNRASRVQSTMLFLTVGIFLIPTVFSSRSESTTTRVDEISDAIAVVLIVLYGLGLLFMMRTHASLFRSGPEAGEPPPDVAGGAATAEAAEIRRTGTGAASTEALTTTEPVATAEPVAAAEPVATGPVTTTGHAEPEPIWSPKMAAVVLAVATVLVTVAAEIVTGSIEGAGSALGLTTGFLGFVLLPLVGNAAEQFSALALAAKDRLDVAADIAVGASIQLVMLVVPILVLIGEVSGNSFALVFDTLELAVLLVSVLLVRQLVDDRKTNWFEGAVLLGLYVAFAAAAFFVQV
ncbi:MAG: hypothetical protein ACLGIA_02510 [Actinomycetes bacterium]